MTKWKYSVLLTDGETWESLKLLRCFGVQHEYFIYVASEYPNARSKYSRYCGNFLLTEKLGSPAFIEQIGRLLDNKTIDLIIPVKEKTIEWFSGNLDSLKNSRKVFPIPNLKSLKITLNKWHFQNYIEKIGLPAITSAFLGIPGRNSIHPNALHSLPFPALLRPVRQEGGHGIIKLDSPDDLPRFWNTGNSLMEEQEYFLQSYLSGTDYCMQLYSRHGQIIAHTIQKNLLKRNNYFGPQRLMEFVNNDSIFRIGKELVSSLDWNGFACIDFIEDANDGSYRLLELNPRIGQAILGSLSKGINFADIGYRDAVGIDPPDCRYVPGLYAHPHIHIKRLLSLKNVSRDELHIKWINSGLRFVCRDPKPEFMDCVFLLK